MNNNNQDQKWHQQMEAFKEYLSNNPENLPNLIDQFNKLLSVKGDFQKHQDCKIKKDGKTYKIDFLSLLDEFGDSIQQLFPQKFLSKEKEIERLRMMFFDNAREEFLGDALLASMAKTAIAEHFGANQNKPEYNFTAMFGELVSNHKWKSFADLINVTYNDKTISLTDLITEIYIFSGIWSETHSRVTQKVNKTYANVFESWFGTISKLYDEPGSHKNCYDTFEKFVKPHIKFQDLLTQDFMSQLNSILQGIFSSKKELNNIVKGENKQLDEELWKPLPWVLPANTNSNFMREERLNPNSRSQWKESEFYLNPFVITGNWIKAVPLVAPCSGEMGEVNIKSNSKFNIAESDWYSWYKKYAHEILLLKSSSRKKLFEYLDTKQAMVSLPINLNDNQRRILFSFLGLKLEVWKSNNTKEKVQIYQEVLKITGENDNRNHPLRKLGDYYKWYFYEKQLFDGTSADKLMYLKHGFSEGNAGRILHVFNIKSGREQNKISIPPGSFVAEVKVKNGEKVARGQTLAYIFLPQIIFSCKVKGFNQDEMKKKAAENLLGQLARSSIQTEEYISSDKKPDHQKILELIESRRNHANSSSNPRSKILNFTERTNGRGNNKGSNRNGGYNRGRSNGKFKSNSKSPSSGSNNNPLGKRKSWNSDRNYSGSSSNYSDRNYSGRNYSGSSSNYSDRNYRNNNYSDQKKY